jgi:hypothetical protein
LELVLFADSDWAGDVDTRKSTSGFIAKCNNNIISWRSTKQNVVALSSCEAELIAATKAASYGLWLKKILKE